MAHDLGILIIGAHPDDPDVSAGGTAALFAEAGHRVRLVSLTNGDAGHQAIGGAPLAWRRREEARRAGEVLGAEYVVLDNHDGELVADLERRKQVIGLIREFSPDLILCPRPFDYHPDHRAAGQLVQDASFLVTVPNIVAHVPHVRTMPVIAHVADGFTKPVPFAPDVAVDIGQTVEKKVAALASHESQFFEWLPYNRQEEDRVPEGAEERARWLRAQLEPRLRRDAERFRALLLELYGAEAGAMVQYAEAFEISEYGRRPSRDELKRLFPFGWS